MIDQMLGLGQDQWSEAISRLESRMSNRSEWDWAMQTHQQSLCGVNGGRGVEKPPHEARQCVMSSQTTRGLSSNVAPY